MKQGGPKNSRAPLMQIHNMDLMSGQQTQVDFFMNLTHIKITDHFDDEHSLESSHFVLKRFRETLP